jgi:O-antigen/teichoic acid export membrane protein
VTIPKESDAAVVTVPFEAVAALPEPGAPSPGRRVVKALLASGGAKLVVMPVAAVANLVTARLVTGAVGIELFGAVMLIATLSQSLNFADMGVGAPVATATSNIDGTTASVERFRRILLTAVRTMLISASVLGLVALGLAVFGLWAPVLGIPEVPTGLSASAATALALLAFSASLPFFVGEALLRGGGRTHQAVLLTGLSAPVSLVLVLVLHAVAAPAYTYALALPLGLLAVALGCGIRGRSVFKDSLRGLAGQVLRPRRYPGLPVAAMAVPWFIIMIGLPIALQSDRIILAQRADDVSLSHYTYAAQLYLPMWSVIAVAALALWPVFAKAEQKPGGMRRSWLTGTVLLTGVSVVFAGGLLLLGGPVIDWMSAGAAHPSWWLLGGFALLLLVQALHVTSGIMLISPSQLRFQAVCVVLLVVTNVPLSWWLTPYLGAAGPVIASAVTVLVCQLVPCALLAWRVTGRSVPPAVEPRSQPDPPQGSPALRPVTPGEKK